VSPDVSDAQDPESTPHHVNLPPALEAITEDLREDASIEGTMFSKAIGGWRGIIDSSLPALVFLLVYLFDKTDLERAVWSAVIAGVLIAAWRLFRRQSIQQVLAGFVGVAISAFLAAKTGNAANFFLPGLLINIAYGIAMVVSVLVRWPLIGVLVGGATGDISGWRTDDQMRRAYSAATWIWAGAFFLRVLVQVPLYLAGLVGPLGVTKLAMGWPLTLLAGWWTYRIIRPAYTAAKDRAMADRVAPTEASDD